MRCKSAVAKDAVLEPRIFLLKNRSVSRRRAANAPKQHPSQPVHSGFVSFQKIVLKHYREHGRHDLPWRLTRDPYRIMVSEIMLQQTQVDRVVPFYERFLKEFPTAKKLAAAPLSEVLKLWSGLGYNRRGKFLHDAAKVIVDECSGKVPKDTVSLRALPGIGPYTASAIRTFAWNEPDVFIETNIRATFLHDFFPTKEKVHDRELLELMEQTAIDQDPRVWHWALMDYGAYLKKTQPNPSRKSSHHVKQSKFEGSLRQVRGAVLRALATGPLTIAALTNKTTYPKDRLDEALLGLSKDGMIEKVGVIWKVV